jgi:hypothetical protein
MTVEEVTDRLVSIDVEIKDLEAQAKAHEMAAQELRLKRTEARKAREGLRIALESAKVKQAVLSDRQAAAEAKGRAESHEADLERMKAEVAAELKKLKEANDGSATESRGPAGSPE